MCHILAVTVLHGPCSFDRLRRSTGPSCSAQPPPTTPASQVLNPTHTRKSRHKQDSQGQLKTVIACIRQSRPVSDRGFQVNAFKTLKVVPCSLGRAALRSPLRPLLPIRFQPGTHKTVKAQIRQSSQYKTVMVHVRQSRSPLRPPLLRRFETEGLVTCNRRTRNLLLQG